MTQQSEQPAVTVDADSALESRMSSLLETLRNEPHEDADETDADEPAALTPATPAKKNPEASDDPAVQRNEALDRARDLESKNVKKQLELSAKDKEARRIADQLTSERADLDKRMKAVEAREREFDDPLAVLKMIEDKVGPEKLTQWIIAQSDPIKRAELAAKAAARTAAGETSAETKKLAEEVQQLREERDRERAEKATLQARTGFAQRVQAVAAEAPLVARLFERKPEKALAMADEIARSFTAEFNFDDVILEMRKRLDDDADLYAPSTGAASDQTSNDQQPTRAAAAKANNLSNRAAAARSSIVDDDDSGIPLEERTRRLERRLRSVR